MFRPRLLTEKCRQLSFWARNSGNEKMLTGRRQPVGPDEGERGGEKWPLDKDYQGQVCLVQGYIWCVLIRAQRALDWIDQASYHQVSEHPGRQPAQPPLRPHHQRLWSRRIWAHRPVTEVVVCQGGRCPYNVNSILQFTGARRTQTSRSTSKVQKPCFHRSTEKK